MIRKDDSVKINNLNPRLQKLIPKLDVLHKDFTGSPLVITSGNDSIHWGGIKEKNRPLGWEKMTEDEVRGFSDSAHYIDDAFDFRKKCPYGKMTYYHNLSLPDRVLFLMGAREMFIKQRFDVVECPACLHVEWDPKWVKDIPKPRVKPPPDYAIPEVPENVKVPIYKRNQFKRKLGAVVGVIGGICCLIPHPAIQAIGQGIIALGGVTTAIGGLDALKKNRQKTDDTYVDKNKWLAIIADIVIWLIGKLIKNKEK